MLLNVKVVFGYPPGVDIGVGTLPCPDKLCQMSVTIVAPWLRIFQIQSKIVPILPLLARQSAVAITASTKIPISRRRMNLIFRVFSEGYGVGTAVGTGVAPTLSSPIEVPTLLTQLSTPSAHECSVGHNWEGCCQGRRRITATIIEATTTNMTIFIKSDRILFSPLFLLSGYSIPIGCRGLLVRLFVW